MLLINSEHPSRALRFSSKILISAWSHSYHKKVLQLTENPRPTCFAIMPIADPEGYLAGHFRHVYEDIIVPACELAMVNPTRADKGLLIVRLLYAT